MRSKSRPAMNIDELVVTCATAFIHLFIHSFIHIRLKTR